MRQEPISCLLALHFEAYLRFTFNFLEHKLLPITSLTVVWNRLPLDIQSPSLFSVSCLLSLRAESSARYLLAISLYSSSILSSLHIYLLTSTHSLLLSEEILDILSSSRPYLGLFLLLLLLLLLPEEVEG
ncbi:wsv080 [White spot syndrome virus]|uniref:Wsv080 n=4 Tax=White spot syndrome virus TaxID=342409 RepID=Q8VBA0_WSSVS|nr:wsv080 [Shrimp white spot syndrome virus]AFX59457.1 wsv080 [White spot syndrome virus]AAL33084.1 wsv080 [Shrimp white spot syndrome virus]AAL89005.1 WSSV137 [Shrimp white spot syndrome virus]AWQ60269.1 wsv080 [Shrimp white spot syndrome virus]AWQ60686.1 wsv080 [Shrimp white spot syndrome virus]